MKLVKRVFGWLLKAFAALIVLIAIFATLLIFLSRQERALAKEFVSLVGQDRYADAHDLFSEELKQIYPVDLMKSQFEKNQDYTDVSFNGINWANGQLILVGSATTESDCKSPITFVFVDELITKFQVDNPCLNKEQSA